ncbi:sterol O-acyltransferase 1 [Orussus abietinus]|uniref:sterol O-acyltransferase 1 n=1 Tax=Orussus abietinus TaxID=222816 RepID=UPI0006268CBD|nr:sterol O-acyltransferase 1 [Orussus abietinus]
MIAQDQDEPTKKVETHLRQRNTEALRREATQEVNGTAYLEEDIMRGMTVESIRERMREVQHEMERVNDSMNDMVSEVMQRLEAAGLGKANKHFDSSESSLNKRSSKLPDKVFVRRNSLLNDLFKIKHFQTIYNIFLVILIILFTNIAVYDIMHTGSTNLGLATIRRGFGKFSTALFISFLMTLASFMVYIGFSLWAHHRVGLSPKSHVLKIWDYGAVASMILFQVVFIILPLKAIFVEDLPEVSSIIVLMEQVRLLMKNHAFVRGNVPRVLAYKLHSEKSEELCPGFSKFLYFMFAPTLIYRDNYPRTKEIKWRSVVWYAMEVIMIVFYVAFIFERFLVPAFQEFGIKPLERRTVILSILGNMMPGILVLMCGFYLLLHSWMNGAAELLRFGDRMFYSDWWNSTSYGGFYRSWNIVVYDWLYTYIYKDMYENVTAQNKVISSATVFAVSAIFHEYILAFGFRFFYPALMVSFGLISFLFVLLTKKQRNTAGNIFIWLTLCVGAGCLLSGYSLEYYARVNCPPYEDPILDLFIPRSLICNGFSTAP